MLTQEQWDALPAEEQVKRQAEKPSAEEDMVVIGGQKRPLKNFIAEITRKVKEDVIAETRNNNPTPPPPKQPDNTDWRRNIASRAEKEMEETGSIVPVNTILDLINQGTSYHVNQFSTANKNAQKVIKETRKELKTTYKDYSEYEDRFDEILDGIEPQNVSKEGLKIIFNSLRGEKLDELLKKERERGSKEAEEGKTIIGDVSSGSGSSSGTSSSGKLTIDQESEMSDMGFESKEDYLGRLIKYREIAKRRGAKNIPALLSEKFTFN